MARGRLCLALLLGAPAFARGRERGRLHSPVHGGYGARPGGPRGAGQEGGDPARPRRRELRGLRGRRAAGHRGPGVRRDAPRRRLRSERGHRGRQRRRAHSRRRGDCVRPPEPGRAALRTSGRARLRRSRERREHGWGCSPSIATFEPSSPSPATVPPCAAPPTGCSRWLRPPWPACASARPSATPMRASPREWARRTWPRRSSPAPPSAAATRPMRSGARSSWRAAWSSRSRPSSATCRGFSTSEALLALIAGLETLPGRKAVVLFSEGVAIPAGVDATFRSVVAAANRANVSFYAADAAGLRVASSGLETRREVETVMVRSGPPDLSSMGTGSRSRPELIEDTLRLAPEAGLGRLAAGDRRVPDQRHNDLGAGLLEMDEELGAYYVAFLRPEEAGVRRQVPIPHGEGAKAPRAPPGAQGLSGPQHGSAGAHPGARGPGPGAARGELEADGHSRTSARAAVSRGAALLRGLRGGRGARGQPGGPARHEGWRLPARLHHPGPRPRCRGPGGGQAEPALPPHGSPQGAVRAHGSARSSSIARRTCPRARTPWRPCLRCPEREGGGTAAAPSRCPNPCPSTCARAA